MKPTVKYFTSYTTEWQKMLPWLRAGDSPYTAQCMFQISGIGVCQVDSHAKLKGHMNVYHRNHRAQ